MCEPSIFLVASRSRIAKQKSRRTFKVLARLSYLCKVANLTIDICAANTLIT